MKLLALSFPQPQLIPEGVEVKCLVCNSTYVTEKNENGWPAIDLLPQIAWRKICTHCNQPIIIYPKPEG